MTSLKQVKETGEYRQGNEESSSEDESHQISDDDVSCVKEDNKQSSSDEDSSDDNSASAKRKPLYFVYDSESTGGDIYRDHIMEIAATAVLPDKVKLQDVAMTFETLVSTSRRIIPAGK